MAGEGCPGAGAKRRQPSAVARLTEAGASPRGTGHHPTAPKGAGLGKAAMVPSVDTGGHSEGQGNPAFFTRWPLNQKEERPLAPHLV